jgi:hypothetical protein
LLKKISRQSLAAPSVETPQLSHQIPRFSTQDSLPQSRVCGAATLRRRPPLFWVLLHLHLESGPVACLPNLVTVCLSRSEEH